MKKNSICNSLGMLSILTATAVVALPQAISAAFCSGSGSSMGGAAGYQEPINTNQQQELIDVSTPDIINI